VGEQLCKYLRMANYEVTLVRREKSLKAQKTIDNPFAELEEASRKKKGIIFENPILDKREYPSISWEELEDCGLPKDTVGVVNVAGENVLNPLRRWNEEFRKQVYSSRVNTTRILAAAIKKSRPSARPTAFVCMSGVGFYPPGDEIQDEASPGGEHDFLARLCVKWEEAARLPEELGCRSVSLRSGVVLGRRGGMIQQLIYPFWLGLGGRMGSGDQPLPWIHVKDLASLVLHCLEEDACRGVLNAVAPEVVRNSEFVAEFGRALGRPAVVPVPESVFNLLYGEERAAMITRGQVVFPDRTLETGFSYDFPTLREALEECAHVRYIDPDDESGRGTGW